MPEILLIKVSAYFSSIVSNVIYVCGGCSIRRGVFSEAYTHMHTLKTQHAKNTVALHCPLLKS